MERLLSSGAPEPEEVFGVNELEDLRAELAELREDFTKFRASIERDRNQLGSMLHGLRSVFSGGAVPASATTSVDSGTPQPHSREKWDAWKQQLPSNCGRLIDALLIQPLTQTQMVGLCKMRQSGVSASLMILRRNSLVEQDGKMWKLKRL